MNVISESESIQKVEIIRAINELVLNLQLTDPILSMRIGQSEPDSSLRRDGKIAYADGTNWNPGGGKGLYIYLDSSWHLLNGYSNDELDMLSFYRGMK